MVVAALVIVFLLAREAGWIKPADRNTTTPPSRQPEIRPPQIGSDAIVADPAGGAAVEAAFRLRRSDVWIEATGVIVKLLPDDRDGEAHQKMLVRVDGGDNTTILVAHSLEAADRIPAREGDRIRFRGEYEWTDKGGTLHFTHAPKFDRKEPGGWIDFAGERYE